MLAAVPACGFEQTDADLCVQAADHIETCTGVRPALPEEGCVDAYRDSAAAALEHDCDDTIGGKADDEGFWCWPTNRWMGRCTDSVEIESAAAITGLDAACPVGRRDVLCDSMRLARSLTPDIPLARDAYRDARDEVTAALAADREAAIADPAVRYYMRERSVSLVAYNIIDASSEPADYAARVREVLREHYPAYNPAVFHMAQAWLPPLPPAACDRTQILLWFPGVMRLTRRDEWFDQWRTVQEAMPCVKVTRVDAGSFVSPEVNAEQAKSIMLQADWTFGDDVPIHMMGYSQGARNALQTLLDYPEIAARTQSVLTINSAARGSEVGDLLYRVMTMGSTLCDRAPLWLRPTCDWAAERSNRPHDLILGVLARAMSVSSEELGDFVEAEDAVENVDSIREMFERHMQGVRSLTTGAGAEFWSGTARNLPSNVLYMSFRSAITRPELNLPGSNKLFFELLERAGGNLPWNDMQVRLPNQRLAGSVADREMVSPVCEGNHWQWVLADGAVPESLMPAHMAERTPHRELFLGYYQTLLDVDLL